MPKVLGIDIGARFVMAFCLSELPTGKDYPSYYREHAKTSIYKIRLNNDDEERSFSLKDAIDLLTQIKPDCIVLEPTGVWYSRLWKKVADHLGIEVKWIGHADLANYRHSYGFKDKDDRTDAFCLAVTYFDPVFNAKSRWLSWRTGAIADVNDRSLEIKSLETSTKILKQQIRQRLKYEFPEVADRSINNERTTYGFTAWLGYLAGIHTYKRIENERELSIATALGIEISTYTRDHAADICGKQIRESQLKAQLAESLLDPAFDRYRPILEKFGFGYMMQAAILSQIYPFEKFLASGKEHIDRYEDDRGMRKKNKSLAGFQISLGMGKRLIESGGKSTLTYSGSGYCRRMLYCWTIAHVLPVKMQNSWLVKELDRRALSNSKPADTVADLRVRWKTTKGTPKDRHMAGIRAAMTLNYRITRLLYDELLKELMY
jgi:uncharacterized protein involved in tolerance to divalent cations